MCGNLSILLFRRIKIIDTNSNFVKNLTNISLVELTLAVDTVKYSDKEYREKYFNQRPKSLTIGIALTLNTFCNFYHYLKTKLSIITIELSKRIEVIYFLVAAISLIRLNLFLPVITDI